MRRREFITLLGGAAVAWPLASHAQEAGQVHRIGFLGSALDNPITAAEYPLFTAELRKLGFSEGKNLTIEYRRADEGASRAFAAASELVRSGVEVTVTFGPELTVKAAVAASQTVPIVMIAINFDPVAGGYVRSIARPDKNITGLLSLAPALATKQLELLVDAFPNEKPVAVLWETASADLFDAAQRAAQSLHIELHSRKLENPPYDFAVRSKLSHRPEHGW